MSSQHFNTIHKLKRALTLTVIRKLIPVIRNYFDDELIFPLVMPILLADH